MTEELIESYINGEMEVAIRQEFEERLKEDIDLASDIQVHESIVEGIKDRGREKLRMRFLQLEYQLLEDEAIENLSDDDLGIRSHLKWGIAMLVIIIPLIYYLIPSKNPHQIFDDYYEVFENETVLYASGQQEPTLYERAFTAYDDQDYAKAVKLFEELEKSSTDRIAVPFFLAMSYLANDQAEVALHKYWMLSQLETHDFLEESQWYLALSMVRVGKMASAKKELKKIVLTESKYKERAKRLLQRL